MPNSYDNLMKYGITNAFAIMTCAFTVPAAKLSAEFAADKYGHNEETWGLIGTAVGLSPLAFTLLLTAYGWMKDCRSNDEVNEEQASLIENDELSTNFEIKESPRQRLSLFKSCTNKVFGCLKKAEQEGELGGLRPDFHA